MFHVFEKTLEETSLKIKFVSRTVYGNKNVDIGGGGRATMDRAK